jgi:hypothetical protein
MATVVSGFPITDEMSLKRYGSVCDVRYSIVNHSRGGFMPEGTWCYYVHIYEDMLPDGDFDAFWLENQRPGERLPTYNYWEAPWADAEWHGGVTFYEKTEAVDGTPRGVRIGCDFAHLHDQHMSYDYADVERQAIATVEALRRMYKFHRRCCWDGSWNREEDMVDLAGRLIGPKRAAQLKAEGA